MRTYVPRCYGPIFILKAITKQKISILICEILWFLTRFHFQLWIFFFLSTESNHHWANTPMLTWNSSQRNDSLLKTCPYFTINILTANEVAANCTPFVLHWVIHQVASYISVEAIYMHVAHWLMPRSIRHYPFMIEVRWRCARLPITSTDKH